MKKKLSAIIAAAMIMSTLSVQAHALIDTNDLPEPLSSDSKDVQLLRFRQSKPALDIEGAEPTYPMCCINSSMQVTWKPVKSAMLYYVYTKTEYSDEYRLIEKTLDTSAYINCPEDTYVCVRAAAYNDSGKLVFSQYSDPIKCKAYYPIMPYDYSIDDNISYANAERGTAGISGSMSAPEETAALSYSREEYGKTGERGYSSAENAPVSSFGIDTDTASYSVMRRKINEGEIVPEASVRIEEMINYFEYEHKKPEKGEPFAVTAELSSCPWNENAQLMMIGVNGADIPEREEPASNIVFLVDVSGSMDSEDKLPAVISSLKLLSSSIKENDKLSIVTYSGQERAVLCGAGNGMEKAVAELVGCLYAGGATNGENGINAAYEIAEKYYIKGGNNRIIIATDGDLNLGISDENELAKLIGSKREKGIYLSVLGFGEGNLKDNKLHTIAQKGNGSYHYIDCPEEMLRVLEEERTKTLFTSARDMKIQVSFDKRAVKSYRLIGYDNRGSECIDYDKAAGGELAPGGQVTALYEIIPAAGTITSPAKVKITWTDAENGKGRSMSFAVNTSYDKKMSRDMSLAAAAAENGMILRNSRYKGTSSFENVLDLLDNAADNKYVKEFRELVKMEYELYTPDADGKELLPRSVRAVMLTHNAKTLRLSGERLNKFRTWLEDTEFSPVYLSEESIPKSDAEWLFSYNDTCIRFVKSSGRLYLNYDSIWYAADSEEPLY